MEQEKLVKERKSYQNSGKPTQMKKTLIKIKKTLSKFEVRALHKLIKTK